MCIDLIDCDRGDKQIFVDWGDRTQNVSSYSQVDEDTLSSADQTSGLLLNLQILFF